MTVGQPNRVEWNETHSGGDFLVIAEWTGSGWKFFEREAWQVRWYAVVSTPALVAKADQLRRAAIQ